MVSNKPVADLKGVVINAYPPKKNENGKWRPANFVIETESGQVKVKRFPDTQFAKDQGVRVTPEPITMPDWYNKLVAVYGESLYDLVGATIQVTGEGTINPFTMEVEYTVVGESFVVLEDEALEPDDEVAALGKSTPAPVQKNPVPTPPSIDPNQMRIMRQSTLHYASLLMVPIVKDFDHPQTMVERTIWLAGKLLEYVITGEMPFEPEVEADEPDEDII